ncbi:hypothetical protein DL89DRAFT_269996 [Linderina pennispora]|uniref:Uncharacterized protein n=1 Tax=Linderina pennispora TaxID=61395 RepID=A0A1Y1VYT9_9FUNG|nr:uncharacterized protein DL89DRAFT_269996 [Linderina pennispora]ORX66438.1 hypothetical protein DL89DRAFT_269996 [Linderina pennispora]
MISCVPGSNGVGPLVLGDRMSEIAEPFGLPGQGEKADAQRGGRTMQCPALHISGYQVDKCW